jgi:hypothetical protein
MCSATNRTADTIAASQAATQALGDATRQLHDTTEQIQAVLNIQAVEEAPGDAAVPTSPWSGVDAIHSIRIEGDLTVRDALDLPDGELVTMVVTARLRKVVTDDLYSIETPNPQRITTTLDLTSIDIVNGDDVLSGPGWWELSQRYFAAYDAYWERRTGGRLFRTEPDPEEEPTPDPQAVTEPEDAAELVAVEDDPKGDERKLFGLIPMQRFH